MTKIFTKNSDLIQVHLRFNLAMGNALYEEAIKLIETAFTHTAEHLNRVSWHCILKEFNGGSIYISALIEYPSAVDIQLLIHAFEVMSNKSYQLAFPEQPFKQHSSLYRNCVWSLTHANPQKFYGVTTGKTTEIFLTNS